MTPNIAIVHVNCLHGPSFRLWLPLFLLWIPAILLARLPGFELRWIWWLSVGATIMQLCMNLLLLRREFRGQSLCRVAVHGEAAALCGSVQRERCH